MCLSVRSAAGVRALNLSYIHGFATWRSNPTAVEVLPDLCEMERKSEIYLLKLRRKMKSMNSESTELQKLGWPLVLEGHVLVIVTL